MSYNALLRALGRDTTQPDVAPQPAPPETTCTCHGLEGVGSNPTCPDHPWWARDETVLQLADHPDGPWTAALTTYGGGT